MVFGASVTDDAIAYALTSPRLIPLVERAADAGPVGTGRCAA
jgi:hypothetical protein